MKGNGSDTLQTANGWECLLTVTYLGFDCGSHGCPCLPPNKGRRLVAGGKQKDPPGFGVFAGDPKTVIFLLVPFETTKQCVPSKKTYP